MNFIKLYINIIFIMIIILKNLKLKNLTQKFTFKILKKTTQILNRLDNFFVAILHVTHLLKRPMHIWYFLLFS